MKRKSENNIVFMEIAIFFVGLGIGGLIVLATGDIDSDRSISNEPNSESAFIHCLEQQSQVYIEIDYDERHIVGVECAYGNRTNWESITGRE